MDKIRTVGVDLAKNVFHVAAFDGRGREVGCKRLRRGQLLAYFAQRPPCVVGLEACASAHHWARQLQGLGHRVRLIAPQYVRAYRRGQKNDYNDARAIGEALGVAQMRFVAIKSQAQQDLQCLVRLREGAVRARTAQGNRLRGLLAEYGIVLGGGTGTLRSRLGVVLSEPDAALSERLRGALLLEWQHWQALDARVQALSAQLEAASQDQPACGRLRTIPGFGAIVAAAFASALGDGRQYRRGREAAAALGLVPRQHSSGGRNVLLGISKRGDRYLRSLLVHGARAVLIHAPGRNDALSRWAERIRRERGFNKACVALANKLARIGWAVLRYGQVYQAARAAG